MATQPETRVRPRLDRDLLLRAYRIQLGARLLDEAEARLRRQGRVYFHVSGAGHEAVQAAAALLLRPGEDWFYPYYRDRAFALGIGFTYRDLLRQSMGKATDPCSGGREMPNHFASPELHVVSQSSPTGTQYSQAVGTAEAGLIAQKLPPSPLRPSFRADEIVYVSGGDGSTSEGEFYEAVCTALLKRAPVLFLIEDNSYAISVPVEEQTPSGSISRLLSGFPGLYVLEVDGCDFIASYEGLAKAIAHVRARKGPALVHAHVVRLKPHSDSDDDSLYRPPDEKQADLARDPLPLLERHLVEEGFATPSELQAMREEIEAEIRSAVDDVLSEPDPDPATVLDHLYAPDPVVTAETTPEPDGPVISLVQAVQRTLECEMMRDPRIVVFGEDVADCSRTQYLGRVPGKGGVFKSTHNLQRQFGEHRVFNTPIAEAAIVARAIGMAVRGLRPVVEIQFFDYIWPAMHQIRNEVATMRWRSAGKFACPVVIRVPIGGYVRGGAIYHSQSGEAIFCHTPGLRVVMPSNARDCVGLLRTAIRCEDPVLFLEHKHLYRQPHARAPDPGPDYVIPLGKARMVRPGRHLSVITYGALVEMARNAAETLAAEGIECEILDLRSLIPYDWEAIAATVEKTGKVLVAYEDNFTLGFGTEIAARIAKDLFDCLDAPVARLASKDVWVGYSPALERAALPKLEDFLTALRDLARY